jgi:hypothetical protein
MLLNVGSPVAKTSHIGNRRVVLVNPAVACLLEVQGPPSWLGHEEPAFPPLRGGSS